MLSHMKLKYQRVDRTSNHNRPVASRDLLNALKAAIRVFRVTSLTGLVALGMAAMLTGCGQNKTTHGRGTDVLVGIDTSLSWRPYLGVSAALTTNLAEQLDPDQDRLSLFRVDRKTMEFSSGPAPDDEESLQSTLVRELSARPATNGTFPAIFWKEMADRAERATGPVAIAYLSDSDNDDLSRQSVAALQRAGRELAANRRVVVVGLFGARPENWARLRQAFGGLGDRLVIESSSEMNLDEFIARVNAARSAAVL